MLTSLVCILSSALLFGQLFVNAAPMDPYHHGKDADPNYQPWLYEPHGMQHGMVSSTWHSGEPHNTFPGTWSHLSPYEDPSLPIHNDVPINIAPAGTSHSFLQDQQADISTPALQRPASPPAQLDHVDREILDSILKDLSHEQHASPPRADLGADFPALNSILNADPHLQQANDVSQPPGYWDRFWDYRARLYEARENHRLKEPELLKSLDVLPPMTVPGNKKGRVKFGEDDPAVRNLINSKFFDNKLEWLGLWEIKDFGRTLSKKYPLRASSRELLDVRLPPPNAGIGPLRICVTEHNIDKPTMSLMGTRLEDKPFYVMWGMPEWSNLNHYPVRYLGTAYLKPDSGHAAGDSAHSVADAFAHVH